MALNGNYFESRNVKVFPATYRGTYGEVDDAPTFDPESKLPTEYNLLRTGGLTGAKKSYIISWTGSLLTCIIGGYYFEISNVTPADFKDAEDNIKNLYIKTKSITIKDGDAADSIRVTKVLASYSPDTINLDYKDTDNKYYFTGIYVATNGTGDAFLQPIVLDNEGTAVINNEELLPNVRSGSGYTETNNNKEVNAIQIGYNTKASGEASFANGYQTTASGKAAVAEGTNTTASGESSHAEGSASIASGKNSHAEGDTTIASSTYAHAEGIYTVASNEGAHAEGVGTADSKVVASGKGAHAEGLSTIASGIGAHSEGEATTASGNNAHAEGNTTIASGTYAHAEGKGRDADGDIAEKYVTASGVGSHAEGFATEASDDYAHAEGFETNASGIGSHAEGNTTEASGESSHAEGINTIASGEGAHAEGYETTAISECAHAEGNNTTAGYIKEATSDNDEDKDIGKYSHAEGEITKASGEASHAEGIGEPFKAATEEGEEDIPAKPVTASGKGSHAEGYITVAAGLYSHAEGVETAVNSEGAHAEGYKTEAGEASTTTGSYSHAEGEITKAYGEASHAEGYKAQANGKYAHAEGVGRDAVEASGNNAAVEEKYVIADGDGAHAEGFITKASGNYSHAEGIETVAEGKGSHAEGNNTKAVGDYSHAEGNNSNATAQDSHAEGSSTVTSGEDDETISNIKYYARHAEGIKTFATAAGAHAEGISSNASGKASHAEGKATTASGYAAHAEGISTKASGEAAHAEGNSTQAKGKNSFAAGRGTVAKAQNEFVIGKYNNYNKATTDTSDSNRIFVVGDGSGLNNDAKGYFNAFEVIRDSNKDKRNGYDIKVGEVSIDEIIKDRILELIYPVGSVYVMDVSNETAKEVTVCPIQTALGGTWTRIENTFLYAAIGTDSDAAYGPTKIGGSKDAVIVKHSHTATTGNLTNLNSGAANIKGRFGLATGDWGMTTATVDHWKDGDGGLFSLEHSDKNFWGKEEHIHHSEDHDGTEGYTGNDGQLHENDMMNGHWAWPSSIIFNNTHTHDISHTHEITVDTNGVDGTDRNMPPYLCVYMWKRTT